ncbi:MAG TPA: CopG family transcriptional regulator [Arachnia sp.]|nr:CopG family transcriptional regulator [Arachnia sp.]HMT86692.1 CopG family transcriptional regulator [Arachnia sp.]
MVKTSVYLDDEQKARLDEASKVSGLSQASLIRQGVEQVIQDHLRVRPRMKARVHAPEIVGRTEELLADMGSESAS